MYNPYALGVNQPPMGESDFNFSYNYNAGYDDMATVNIPPELPPEDDGNYIVMMQINGRKVVGPPEDWVGPPPPAACELHVRRIPRNLNDQRIIKPFMRFGRIYEIRLPMDFNRLNRGFAYVKYTNEEDAACAMEVLNHMFVMTRRKMEIMPSNEKNRLFISNIPKHLSELEINEKMRSIFPGMQRLFMRTPINRIEPKPIFVGADGEAIHDANKDDKTLRPKGKSSDGNRGHIFVHFATHRDAVVAKRRCSPGVIRLWGKDLRVVWANAERDFELSTKTLFVRNVDLSVNHRDIIELLVQIVPRGVIRKISKVRTSAFFDFTTHDAAAQCMNQLQGTMLHGQRLDIEWAKPSEQQSLHRMRQTDFDAMLRLKCIANNWQVPVIIFGTYFQTEGYQYAVVMLRDLSYSARAIFCILQPNEVCDIHSRLCETVCMLIETIGTFPDYNYVFFVQKESAHLLGMITHNANNVGFVASYRVPNWLYFDLNELIDLSWAVCSLSSHTEDELLLAYQKSFTAPGNGNYLANWPVWGNRVLGTIMPKYRNKPPLLHNLNDTQIVLALCFSATGTNLPMPSRPFISFPAYTFDSGYEGLRYTTLKLMPNAITQSRYSVSFVLPYIQFGGTEFYHPAKRSSYPPTWVSCCSYMKSLKQPAPPPPPVPMPLQPCVVPLCEHMSLPMSVPLSLSSPQEQPQQEDPGVFFQHSPPIQQNSLEYYQEPPPLQQDSVACYSESPPIQQEPGVFCLESPPIQQDPGVFCQDPPPIQQDSGLFSQEPPPIQQDSGLFCQEPPPIQQEPGVFCQEPPLIVQNSVSFYQEPPPPLQQDSGAYYQEPPPIQQDPAVYCQEPPPIIQNSVSFYQEPPPPLQQDSRAYYQEPPPVQLDPGVYFKEPPPPLQQDSGAYYQEPPPIQLNPGVYFPEPPPIQQDPGVYYQDSQPIQQDARAYFQEPQPIEQDPGTYYQESPRNQQDPGTFYPKSPPNQQDQGMHYQGSPPNQQDQGMYYQESPRNQQDQGMYYQGSPRTQQDPGMYYQESPRTQQDPGMYYQESPRNQQDPGMFYPGSPPPLVTLPMMMNGGGNGAQNIVNGKAQQGMQSP